MFFLKKKKKIKITALLKRHTIVPNIRSSPAEFIDKAASSSAFSGFRCACFHVFGKVVRHYWIPVCAEVCSTDGNLTKEAFDKSTFLMTNFQCSKWWLCSPFLSKFLAAPPRFYSISLLFQALIFLLLWTYKDPHTIHNI